MNRFSGEYTKDWQDIARNVKEKAGWVCVRCKHPHNPTSGYCLTIHHLNGQKDCNKWWNLLALCQRCHLHIQAKVVMERTWMFDHTPWFRPYVAGYYADHYDLPDDEASVLTHIDELIALGQGHISCDEVTR